MHRPVFIVLALALLASAAVTAPSVVSAATIAPTTTCSNGIDNTPGLGLICEVTVVNTVTPSGGSASVTVRECHGAAGNPTAACTTTTTVLTELVSAVTQCNDSTNGGGGTLRCSVQVTNNFVGVSPGASAATVNQCVGSGGGITTGCNPFPATSSGATITQCNGSANGGTLVELSCTATGETSSAAGVLITQCNNSTNGGGALVICSANLTNNAIAPAPTATPTAAPTRTQAPRATATSAGPVGAPGATANLPNTGTTDPKAALPSGTSPMIVVTALLIAALSLIAALRRSSVRDHTRRPHTTGAPRS